MIYLGIDPGKSGALAMIDGDSASVIPFDEKDYADNIRICAEGGAVCCLEHVSAMPGQGVTSVFSFGENFGFIQGVLMANGVKYELVRPQKWKKEFSVTSDKNTSIAVCKRLFPEVSLRRTERSRKDDDGFAEALLMAEYARRNF